MRVLKQALTRNIAAPPEQNPDHQSMAVPTVMFHGFIRAASFMRSMSANGRLRPGITCPHYGYHWLLKARNSVRAADGLSSASGNIGSRNGSPFRFTLMHDDEERDDRGTWTPAYWLRR